MRDLRGSHRTEYPVAAVLLQDPDDEAPLRVGHDSRIRPSAASPCQPERPQCHNVRMSVHLTSGPIIPDRTHPLPLWAQVCTDLRRRIAAGEFASGFPGEMALVDQYEVSRHTVREALRVLRTEGLVRSERGRVSSVEPVSQNLGSLYSLFRTLEDQGIVQRSDVRRQSLTTNATVAEKLGIASHMELVVLERVRYADDVALALDTSWLPAVLAQPLLDVDFSRQGLYEALADTCGVRVDSGHERIAAVTVPAHIAALLRVSEHAAMHHIERIARSNDMAVEWRETFIRGDRFSMDVEWAGTDFSLSTVSGEPLSGPA